MSKILIVDRNRSQAENYGNNLKKFGYEIIYAQDGEAALSKVREVWPDLILLEILLPKIDGLSVLKTLKEDEQTKNIPVLILTKEETPDKRVEAAKLGVTVYFVKRETSFPILENWVKELTDLGVEQKF